MVGVTRRLATVAVPTQVRADDGKPFGEDRGYPMPYDVRLRVAVQKQDRGPAAALNQVDGHFICRDRSLFEPFKHRSYRLEPALLSRIKSGTRFVAFAV